MSLGENIFNAFDIVTKTYENVNKLMDFCRAACSEKREFVIASPKFLRYKSDADISGWYIFSFILLFQNAKDQPLENNWRNGPVYVLEIGLYNPGVFDPPRVNIAKYEYADISSWSEGCSTASRWMFFKPLYENLLEFKRECSEYTGQVVDTDSLDDKWYGGLRKVTGFKVPLTDITGENAYKIIFDGFRSLFDK